MVMGMVCEGGLKRRISGATAFQRSTEMEIDK